MSRTQSKDVTNLTRSNPDTYTSSSLARFAWEENPLGTHGFLHVEFQSGGKYLYMGVPKSLAEELEARANSPEEFEDSVGEFFYKNVRNQFERRGRDYTRLSHL